MLREFRKPENVIRLIFVPLLVAGAVVPAWFGIGALSNLNAEYKDSSDGVYIGMGAIGIGCVLGTVILVARMLWRAPAGVLVPSVLLAAVATPAFLLFLMADVRNSRERQLREFNQQYQSPVPQQGLPFAPATVFPAQSIPRASHAGHRHANAMTAPEAGRKDRRAALREFWRGRAFLAELREPENLARAVIFAAITVIVAAPTLLGVDILSRVWQPQYDNTSAAYIVAATVCFAAASIPAVFALRIIWNAGVGGILMSLLFAVVAIGAFVVYIDGMNRRNALEHIEERGIDSPLNAPPRPVAPGMSPVLTPVATPSLGLPR